jgi:hypothetical protein
MFVLLDNVLLIVVLWMLSSMMLFAALWYVCRLRNARLCSMFSSFSFFRGERSDVESVENAGYEVGCCIKVESCMHHGGLERTWVVMVIW